MIGITIPIPPKFGDVLADTRRELGDPAAELTYPHVTLLPPTLVSTEELEEVFAHCREVAAAAKPFDMVLRGTGTFRPVSPVVYIQVARGVSACEQLEKALRSGPIHRELDFYYHPHVTIAHHIPEPALDQAFEDLADFSASFVVDSFTLYRLDAEDVWHRHHEFTFGEH